MAGNSILDADIRTVGLWLRSGLIWWRSELAAMLPASLQTGPRRLQSFAIYHGPGRIEAVGQGIDRPLLINPALCLVREIDLPAIAATEFAQLIAMEADRIFPLDPAMLAIGHARAGNGRARVAALPLDRAKAMLAELADAGIVPSSVSIAHNDVPGAMDIDLTQGLAAAGLVAQQRDAAMRWWLLAGFLFICNIGLLIWRDVESVNRIEDLVAQQSAAVKSARTISSRISWTQNVAMQLSARRQTRNALGVLTDVTHAMPEAAWVQRYTWDGTTIRITGYRRSQADVASALRNSGQFSDVRSANTEAVAEIQAGLPFDITARVEGAAP